MCCLLLVRCHRKYWQPGTILAPPTCINCDNIVRSSSNNSMYYIYKYSQLFLWASEHQRRVAAPTCRPWNKSTKHPPSATGSLTQTQRVGNGRQHTKPHIFIQRIMLHTNQTKALCTLRICSDDIPLPVTSSECSEKEANGMKGLLLSHSNTVVSRKWEQLQVGTTDSNTAKFLLRPSVPIGCIDSTVFESLSHLQASLFPSKYGQDESNSSQYRNSFKSFKFPQVPK